MLRSKEDKVRLVIEHISIYRKYIYIVVMTYMGHRNGYVILRNRVEDIEEMNIRVHGGITFNDMFDLSLYCIDYIPRYKQEYIKELTYHKTYAIGFDCRHLGDLADIESLKKYKAIYNEEMLKSIKIIDKQAEFIPDNICKPTVKTKEYCINQCKKVINQLIEYKVILPFTLPKSNYSIEVL